MPRNDYEPDWENLFWEDPDPYEDVRYERPLSTREAMDSFMRSFFPEDHFDDPPYEPPSEVVQDIIDEEERAKKAAALAANPEKKVSFHTTFLRCKAYIERFGGRLKFVKGPAPNSLDIVLYVGPAIFRNNEDHDFLLDLGRAAERLFIRAYRGKVQIRIGLPPDNLKY